jgi:hypothetical protein
MVFTRFYMTNLPFGFNLASQTTLFAVMSGMGSGNKDEVRGTNIMSATLSLTSSW